MSLRYPTPWTWEEHELSEGYSCIVYDARGRRVGVLDHLDRETAIDIVKGVNTRKGHKPAPPRDPRDPDPSKERRSLDMGGASFKCPQCEWWTFHRSSLKDHLRDKHGLSGGTITGVGTATTFVPAVPPDPSRPGIFRDHNCAGCRSGELPCREGNSNSCSYPHARND